VVTPGQLFIAAASDGSDNGTKAGVLVDGETLTKMKAASVDVKAELAALNTLPPFEKIGDVLDTGRTGANVSDWYLLATKKD
ncbi:MAG TPA: MOFRL family protein, partial [Candidatus Paceibacterota bacterium]